MVIYEKEFKEQAVKMVEEIGTAKDLGIHVNMLYTSQKSDKVYTNQPGA